MIYNCPPNQIGREEQYVKSALQSNYLAPIGEFVDIFERSMAKYLKVNDENVTTTSSGSSALHLALIQAGVTDGDVVFSSSFTFAGAVFPILQERAKPVFIGSGIDGNCTLELFKKALESEPVKPKAFILTHIYGNFARDIFEIYEICKRENIILIEDTAESLGARAVVDDEEIMAGTIGDYGIFSFNGNKLITTSGGGLLYAKNSKDVENVKNYAFQSKDKGYSYTHSKIGFNYKLSNVLCALGIAQLEKITIFIGKKRENNLQYREELNQILGFEAYRHDSVRWMTLADFSLYLDQLDLDSVISRMYDNGVELRRAWTPMQMVELFKEYPVYTNGIEEHIYNSCLCLPSGTSLQKTDREYIVKMIKDTILVEIAKQTPRTSNTSPIE